MRTGAAFVISPPLRAAMARLGQGSALALVFLVLFCSASVVSSQCNTQGVDRTLEDGATGEDVVKATADKIRESGIFGDDHDFLRRMAKVESDNGREMGLGGIWRVDFGILKDMDKFILSQQETPTLQSQFEEHFCFSWSANVTPIEYRAMDVPLYSALTVMVYLSSIGQNISQNIEQQAKFWTKFLNRNGDKQEFINCSRSLGGNIVPTIDAEGVDMVFVMDECNTQGVDRTLEDGATGEDVVKATADKIRESGIFGDDHDFLRRMAKVESDNGREMGLGGIWRVDFGILKDMDKFILSQQETPTLQSQFEEHFCFSWSANVTPIEYRAMDVPLYSALTVMVYLSSIGQNISQNIEQQAEFWTKHLNRNGDKQEFISISRSLRGNKFLSSTNYISLSCTNHRCRP